MKVSLSWLKDYVPVDMTAQELADALTMAGLEVETVTDRYAYLDTVVAGRIINISPHPKADRLKVCEVDIGDRQISVVCGAPNIEVGMKAPCALPGTPRARSIPVKPIARPKKANRSLFEARPKLTCLSANRATATAMMMKVNT